MNSLYFDLLTIALALVLAVAFPRAVKWNRRRIERNRPCEYDLGPVVYGKDDER